MRLLQFYSSYIYIYIIPFTLPSSFFYVKSIEVFKFVNLFLLDFYATTTCIIEKMDENKKINECWNRRYQDICDFLVRNYNASRKSASHICAVPQKNQLQLNLPIVVNKTQIYPINTRCRTHHIPTHITQSMKLGHHNLPHLNP